MTTKNLITLTVLLPFLASCVASRTHYEEVGARVRAEREVGNLELEIESTNRRRELEEQLRKNAELERDVARLRARESAQAADNLLSEDQRQLIAEKLRFGLDRLDELEREGKKNGRAYEDLLSETQLLMADLEDGVQANANLLGEHSTVLAGLQTAQAKEEELGASVLARLRHRLASIDSKEVQP